MHCAPCTPEGGAVHALCWPLHGPVWLAYVTPSACVTRRKQQMPKGDKVRRTCSRELHQSKVCNQSNRLEDIAAESGRVPTGAVAPGRCSCCRLGCKGRVPAAAVGFVTQG